MPNAALMSTMHTPDGGRSGSFSIDPYEELDQPRGLATGAADRVPYTSAAVWEASWSRSWPSGRLKGAPGVLCLPPAPPRRSPRYPSGTTGGEGISPAAGSVITTV